MKLTVKQMSREQMEDYIIQLHQLMFGKDNAYADLMFNWGKKDNG